MRNAPASTQELIEAVLDNELLYELGALIPSPDPVRGGRPRLYPGWALLLFDSLVSIFHSQRRVETELSYGDLWPSLRRRSVERFPYEPEMWLPPAAMRAHHYRYGRDTFLCDQTIWASIRATFVATSARQATDVLGLCREDGPGSLTHPDLSRMLYADGKVVTPLYKAKPGSTAVDRETGEVRLRRADPDASLHVTGSGEQAFGVKSVIVACRSSSVHGRMILDFEHVSTSSEAHHALRCIANVSGHLPGAQGVLYDGAFRGKHCQELLRDRHLLPVVPVAAERGGMRVRKPRIERTVFVEEVPLPDGGSLGLYARAGALGYTEYDESGEPVFVALDRRKVEKRVRRSDGTARWYGVYALPVGLGGTDLHVRLDISDEDRRRGFNRTEHLRAIPPDDPDFMRLYPRRSDVESINRALDDSLWLGRAHSLGAARQQVDLLGFALVVNSLALLRARRAGDPPTALAA